MYAAHIALDANGQERVQTCTEHSTNTAELAKRVLMDVDLPWTGYLAGLLHDCGKFTEEFDAYIRQAARGESVHRGSVIHTFAAVSYLLSRYHGAEDENSCRNLTAEILAAAVASHHGWIDLYDENHESGFEHRLRKQPAYDRRAIKAFTSECCDCKRLDELFSLAEREIENYISNKLPLCADESSYEELLFVSGLIVRLITSALVAADRTDTAAFMQGIPLPDPQSVEWMRCERNVDAYLGRFDCTKSIAAARKVFSDACALAAKKQSGIFRLDLPTGGGKTLAALRFAVKHARIHKKKRIIYAAPLLSILEQNALVIRAAVGDSVQVLEHHSNVVQEQSKSNELNTSELLQESWENPLIVTTMVQMLETMFGGKMSSVRRFQALCDSVIILDEVQSLPVKMLTLFNLTINFLAECCGTTVVLCSATQPAFAKAQHRMNDHEVIVSEALRREYAPLFKRTVIHDGGAVSMEELVQRAMFQITEAQSLLIVCNTKKEAAQLYELLREESDCLVYHLSAGMCMAHRKKVLAEITEALQSGERLICVSTQLIEAGIDISFASVIRLSAGLDSVVQTAGRCNRHGESPEPRPVTIYRLTGERLGTLKEIKASQDALNALLAEYSKCPQEYEHDLSSDAAVEAYYGFLYRAAAKSYGAQDYPARGRTIFEFLSSNEQYVPEEILKYTMNQAFRTAGEAFRVFDEDNVSVVVPYEAGAELIEALASVRAEKDFAYKKQLVKAAAEYAVSVPRSRIADMMRKNMLYALCDGSIYVLQKENYSEETGITEGDDGCGILIL